jgi:hypothetical protein
VSLGCNGDVLSEPNISQAFRSMGSEVDNGEGGLVYACLTVGFEFNNAYVCPLPEL